MKRISFAAFLFLALLIMAFSGRNEAFGQTPSEKLIATVPPINGYVDAYSLRYDPRSGAWAYNSYDTIAYKYSLITSAGTSDQYGFINQYDAIFDDAGNIYTVVSKQVDDTSWVYYVMKNTQVLSPAYSFLNEGWGENGGIIYYTAGENGRAYMNMLDTRTGTITKSKPYDEIRLVFVKNEADEGEPVTYIGFTPEGKPYYVAGLNNEVFLVIGDDEQKHYSDISYDVKFDKNGVPAYIAKDRGKMYEERGNTFVVHGSEEYKKFDWIYGTLIFDGANNPIYVGQDSIGEYKYRSTMMAGSKQLKSIDGNIYTYQIAPNGKLAYIVNEDKGESDYLSYVVYDGKEGKRYQYINELKFLKGSDLFYTAGDNKNKYVIVNGDEASSMRYDNVFGYSYLPSGKFCYCGTNYGNYEKHQPDKNYVFVGDESYGPYDVVYTNDWETNAVVVGDNKGTWAYTAGKEADYENYYFRYRVYTNKWKSKEYDNIPSVKVYNGHVVYVAGNQVTKGVYVYDNYLFIDNKKVGDSYSSVNDLKVDASGKLSFMGSRGNNIYLVEVQL